MSKYDEAREVLKNSIHRIIGGETPIDFIGLCDFSKSTPDKSILRIPRDSDHDIMSSVIDLTHIKRMIAIERQKYVEDSYVETRYEKAKGGVIAWHPVGRHNMVLLFASRSNTNLSDFEFAVQTNLEELDTEVKAVLDALTAHK